MAIDILPDSRPQVARAVKAYRALNWVPIFCANCGADGGMVPEENMTFAFYLCQPCADRWGAIAGTYMEPDEVFWKKVHDAMMEKFGRILTPEEQALALQDENHILSKLAKERK